MAQIISNRVKRSRIHPIIPSSAFLVKPFDRKRHLDDHILSKQPDLPGLKASNWRVSAVAQRCLVPRIRHKKTREI